MGQFPFPVHDRRRTRDMAKMSRQTAFVADAMADRLAQRASLIDARGLDIGGQSWYQGAWPAWGISNGTFVIKASGGSPSLSGSSVASGAQPDPTDSNDHVGHIFVGHILVVFDSSSSLGTGTFGFTLPRVPKVTNGLLGWFVGHANFSSFQPIAGACVHRSIGGFNCVAFHQQGEGLLTSATKTWDLDEAYIDFFVMYEVA